MAERRAKRGGYARWRKRRKIRKEARQLIKEARRILRKYGYRIDDKVADEVARTCDELKEALAGERFGPIRERLERLDELVDRHLAFGRKSAVREYAESIGIAVLVALLLRAFVVEAFKIPSGSMIPTLRVGDHIFVNKFIYGFRVPFTNIKFWPISEPRRGEVVVFVYPEDEDKDFIKRIVGVPGDVITFDDNVPVINGKPIKRRPLQGPCVYPNINEGSDRWELRQCQAFEEEQSGIRYRVIQDVNSYAAAPERRRIKVPAGHVFVMGDNRDNSHDSRYWADPFVPYDYIKGRAIIIWWSYGQPDGVRWWRFFDRVHAEPDHEPITVRDPES